MTQATTGELVKSGDLLRDETRMARLVGTNIKSPVELRQRIEEIQQHAFVLSPMTAISSIAPGYEITPVVVVIDPSVDPESGRGADVYFQRSIHKSKKVDRPGGGFDFLPVEVSLNAQGLARILAAVGVNVHDSIWTQDGSRERYLWVCETAGDVIEFDGRLRKLPAGIGSLDARDGAADIGEWTPEEWADRVKIAEAQKKNAPEKDKWKIKAEPINGWTAERVAGVRKYGRQLAKTKSLNGLSRRLGVRQSYSIEELKRKPFVILRPMFMPDMTNTEIAKMVTAANLGARFAIYPGAALPSGEGAPISHGHGEPMHTLPGEVVETEQESAERMRTAAPPSDAAEIVEEEPAKAQPQPPVGTIYTVTNILGKGKGPDAQYFVETKEGITLFFTDPAMLKPMQAAKKDGQPREISTERVMVGDKPYRQIIESSAPGGLKY